MRALVVLKVAMALIGSYLLTHRALRRLDERRTTVVMVGQSNGRTDGTFDRFDFLPDGSR